MISPLPEPDRGGILSGITRAASDVWSNLKRVISTPFGPQQQNPVANSGDQVTQLPGGGQRVMFGQSAPNVKFQPTATPTPTATPSPTAQLTPTPISIDNPLLDRIAQVESTNNPGATNSASGAMGMYQFMPQTVQFVSQLMGKQFDPYNPQQAREAATVYLNYLLKKFGSLPLVLAAYNAGEGNVEKYGGIPPLPETQDYVKKILGGVI